MNWNYKQPVEIFFGNGRISELKSIIEKAKRPLLVSSPFFARNGLAAKLLADKEGEIFSNISVDPDVSEVNECAKLVRKIEPDIIIAIGGGSTIDLAKAVSICADDISVYHGTGKKVPEEHIPIIAVPTTSGTGSEVTCVSVLTDRIRGIKAPIVSESFYPKAAIIDPELTISVPPNVTASTGIDVLCHAVEGYWSKGHQPICDALADKIFELKKSLGLRTSLADLKLDSKQITELVRLSHHPNMDNNPVSITDDILTDMYNKLSR